MILQFENKGRTVKPGEECTLGVKASNGAFVSLLVVDKSVTLMGSGNDINPERVASELEMYERSFYENDDALSEQYSDLARLNILTHTNANDKIESTCVVDRSSDDKNLDFNNSTVDERVLGFGDDTTAEIANSERNFFPETWLFFSFLYQTDKQLMAYKTNAPHTITTFVANGFSIHPEHGLRIAEPAQIKVFKEFFLKLYIPYAIRQGEILRVHVDIFNYVSEVDEPINVTVHLDKGDGFEFYDKARGSCQFSLSTKSQQKELVVSKKNFGKSEFFYIKALRPGSIEIRVNAVSSYGTDSVVKHVRVLRGGISKKYFQSKTFDMRNKETDSFLLTLPPGKDDNIIENSIEVKVSIAADLLGTTLKNIDKLM